MQARHALYCSLCLHRRCIALAPIRFGGSVTHVLPNDEGEIPKPAKLATLLGKSGGPPGDRTRDTLIKSQVLYH